MYWMESVKLKQDYMIITYKSELFFHWKLFSNDFNYLSNI